MCINYTSYVQAFLCQFCFAASSGLASTNPFPDTLAGFFLGLLWPFDATFPFSAAEGPSSVHKGCPKLKQMRLGAIACGLNSSNQMQKHVSMHHNHASCMLMTTLTSSSQAACTSLQSYEHATNTVRNEQHYKTRQLYRGASAKIHTVKCRIGKPGGMS